MSTILQDGVTKAILTGNITGKSVLELTEKEILRQVMTKCRYNQSKAAKNLGWSRGTIRTKLAYHFKDQYFQQSGE